MPGGAADLKAIVDGHNQEYMSRYAAGDVAAVAGLYSEDGAIIMPGQEPLKGRKVIQEFWSGVRTSGVVRLSVEAIEVERHGDCMAHEYGKFAMYKSHEESAEDDSGKYIIIWKRVGDSWFIYKDYAFNDTK